MIVAIAITPHLHHYCRFAVAVSTGTAAASFASSAVDAAVADVLVKHVVVETRLG
jgi:hypothetical protein